MRGKDDRCESCVYLQKFQYCHRRAPVLDKDGLNPRWPYVQSSDWCGEFERKPPEVPFEDPS